MSVIFVAIQFQTQLYQMSQRIFESITILQKKHYGCFAKIFCCKCIYCCQDFDFSLLTPENRKSAFQKMIKRYIKHLQQIKKSHIIMDPFFILVALFLGQQNQTYVELMTIINNQSEATIFSKEDLEFYIPELCTYLVFHEDLKNMELLKLMLQACKVDIHFSLKYYFYMKSLEFMNIGKQQIRKYESVSKYNNQFRSTINNYYKNYKQQKQILFLQQNPNKKQRIRSNFHKDTESFLEKQNVNPDLTCSIILKQEKPIQITKKNDLKPTNTLKIYEPFIYQSKENNQGIFQSTINFFSDLVQLSKLLVNSNNRKQQLNKHLKEMNTRLPAIVYVPFTKDEYQDLNIVNIVLSESRVFNTKERVPYYICMESFYNPTYNDKMSKDKKIRSFSHTKTSNSKRKDSFEEEISYNQCSQYEDNQDSKTSISLEKYHVEIERKKVQEEQKKDQSQIINWNSFFKFSKKLKRKILKEKMQEKDPKQTKQDTQSNIQQVSSNKITEQLSQLKQIFGQTQSERYEKIRKQSVYSHLPGYKLIHIMIKSNDDLRQQNFAMQLLQEFDKIFKLQNLPVRLLPYEVLPLSHQAGILQFVQDAVTIDQLRKKGKSISQVLNNKTKIKNFIHTLTAYSLITYLLQVKDRHNGNIMIKSDGCIFHIDYGFFISNLPGKGVEIQKNLPFKLTNQYVQALGGIKSKYFQDYRKLFFQAFNACKRHQHRILIMTRLMYTSFGKGMPCFTKGNQALDELQERFNPKGISNDAELSVFCQNLINSSIDNWRSRWYDKWQYYVQGILY